MSSNPFIENLLSRHSVGAKHLKAPGLTKEELNLVVKVALHAPCHTTELPYRFISIQEGSREQLADLFENATKRHYGSDEVMIAKARRKAFNGATLIAMVARLNQDICEDRQEALITTGAALMNALNAIHALGYGAKVVSGETIDDPDLQRALCLKGEHLFAWIVIGTSSETTQQKEDRTDLPLTEW